MRGVFENTEAMRGGKGLQGDEVARLAEEVHRHDYSGARADLAGGVGQIDVEMVRVDVDPDGNSAEARHRTSGRKEGEGRDEDFIAFANIEGHEGEQECIRTR